MLRVDDHKFANKVNHFSKRLAIAVTYQFVHKVNLLNIDAVFRRIWLLACAKEVHDAAERPAVNFEVIV